MALQANAKAEAGHRFYSVYDKISRDGMLAHTWPGAAPTRAHCAWTVGTLGVTGLTA